MPCLRQRLRVATVSIQPNLWPLAVAKRDSRDFIAVHCQKPEGRVEIFVVEKLGYPILEPALHKTPVVTKGFLVRVINQPAPYLFQKREFEYVVTMLGRAEASVISICIS